MCILALIFVEVHHFKIHLFLSDAILCLQRVLQRKDVLQSMHYFVVYCLFKKHKHFNN